jgi:hypothetical protein
MPANEVGMQVHVFRGVGRVFAATARTNASSLPERYAPWNLVKTIEVVRGQPRPGNSVEDCLDDIAQYGIHVTDAHIRITEQAIG